MKILTPYKIGLLEWNDEGGTLEMAFADKYKKEIRVICEAQARLTQEETKAEAINVYEPYIKLLEEEIGDLIGLAATHRWFSSRVEEGKKCRERIKAFKEGQ